MIRARSSLGHSRSHWGHSSGSHASRPAEQRNRSRVSTVIQPLRQNAAEVVDLTVDEDGRWLGGRAPDPPLLCDPWVEILRLRSLQRAVSSLQSLCRAPGTCAKKRILGRQRKPPRLSFVVDPAVVPTTSSRVDAQAASAASEGGPTATPSEQVPGGASGISSSQPPLQPEPSALLSNSGSAAGNSTGGRKHRSLFPQEAGSPEDPIRSLEL